MSTLFAIFSSLIWVYSFCHSQQSDHGLHCLPLSAVWSGSTMFAIRSCLICVYTIFDSPSDKRLQYLPFPAVWSGSTLFAFLLSSIIKVYTTCHSQQSDQGLHHLPFSAVWSSSRSTLSFLGIVWSRSTVFANLSSLIKVKVYTVILRNSLITTLIAILSSLIKVYTVCHSQLSDQHLHYLPFSAVWSGSILYAILSSMITVYNT